LNGLELTYRGFINRIADVNRKDILFKLMRYSLITMSVFAVAAIIFITLEAIFYFPASARMFIFFFYFSALAATISLINITSYLNQRKRYHIDRINHYAGRIGENIPSIKDNLLNAIQLYEYAANGGKYFSNDLAAESIRQVDDLTHGIDFPRIISYKLNRQFAVLFVSSLFILSSMLLAFPNVFGSSAYRLIHYNYNFIENSLGIAFNIRPGNVEASKGEDINISAQVLFNDPAYKTDFVNFNTKVISSEGIELSSNTQKLSPVSQNEFQTVLNNVNSNMVYWFEYKGINSTEYKVTIASYPVIKNVKVTVYPPSYTKLPSHTIDGNEISTIAGSRIYVETQASDPLSKAEIQFSQASPSAMDITGTNATGSFTAMKNDEFNIVVAKDFNGKELTNLNPRDYSIRVYPDEYPRISIIEPKADLELSGENEVTVRTRISDDFGFTKMRLAYKLSKSRYGMTDKDFRYADIPVKNLDATALEVPYIWGLSDLNLGTEDEVEYYVEVFDNDAVSGPKSARSEIQRLIYPSLESLLKKTEDQKEDIESSLKSSYDNAMDLKRELDELRDKLDKNPEELGLNDKAKMQELQNKIENIQNQFSSTQQKLDELMNSLQNKNQISRETLEKYMELQKMFQQIDSKELRDALKKLQEAMKNLNTEELKEALKNFTFDEENFKKAIDRTMDLLKKILNEQKFGDLTKKLDEIAKNQEELKNKTDKTDENDKKGLNELSKTQEQLKKDLEEFRQQSQQLTEDMKKQNYDEITKQLEQLMKEIQKRNIEQKMNESSKQLQQGNKENSLERESEASKDLNEMNQKMQDLLSQMLNSENSKLMAKLQEILSNIQQMSKKQGELRDRSKDLDENSDDSEYKKNTQEQQDLSNELSKTIEELMSLSQQMPMTPQMMKSLGDAFNQMNQASQSLMNKDSKSAMKSQGDAKKSLDKAIERLKSMCKSGNKPGNGNSLSQLLQALQQMIARQQMLNQQMGKMGMNGNYGKYSQEQMAQMQRLAMEQETIRNNLQHLNEEFKKQQELEGKKLLGNLDRVEKDMMEVIKDLQDNNITPETRKRQEKILSRMLDFQLSEREKDFEQKRESRPSKDYDRNSPPEIVISRPNIVDGINQDALEIQKQNYTEDYESLIQKYLRKIENLKQNK
jgi:hypothetical protein